MLELNLVKEALQVFQIVTQEFPENEDTLFYKAQCFLGLGDYAHCIGLLQQCLQINPSNQSAKELHQEAHHKNKTRPSIAFISETKTKREVIHNILKPCSGYGKQWNLDTPYGYEYSDMFTETDH